MSRVRILHDQAPFPTGTPSAAVPSVPACLCYHRGAVVADPLLREVALSPKRKEKARERPPRCIVIAGPNGAGKTTFALEFLPSHAKVIHFVNADSIAGGLSPLRPELAAIAAGRLFLKELDRLAAERKDFAFESTLSGTSYVTRLERWKKAGYRIEIIYLTLPSVEIALSRIAARVRQGGHGVPKPDVLRRSQRSWSNFQSLYRPLADWWWIYDNSRERPKLVEQGP